MSLRITVEDPRVDDVRRLLEHHHAHMLAISPPGTCHVLDLDGLCVPEITLWVARDASRVLGCGALKALGDSQGETKSGEIKSMHTIEAARGRGIGQRLLSVILAEARAREYACVSLETGATPVFEPARRFYTAAGFVPCGPFGGYRPNAHSAFMTLPLAAPRRFMVVETFRPGAVDAVYRRFAEQGRLLPPGLRYVDSWLTADRGRCFQIMETDDPALFEVWIARWSDLVEFEVVPLTLAPGSSD